MHHTLARANGRVDMGTGSSPDALLARLGELRGEEEEVVAVVRVVESSLPAGYQRNVAFEVVTPPRPPSAPYAEVRLVPHLILNQAEDGRAAKQGAELWAFRELWDEDGEAWVEEARLSQDANIAHLAELLQVTLPVLRRRIGD